MAALRRVVVATHNAHKVAEMRAILDIPGWEFVSLEELGIYEEPVEDAPSFEGNARIKARFAHEATGLAALADDSGLVVDALGGAPGIYSSRYAGEQAESAANNAKLLQELASVEEAARTARFVCALVFIDENGAETVSEGMVEGRIGFALQGDNGFGYDPLFLPQAFAYTRSMAELSADEKNALSHRYVALTELKGLLDSSSPTTEYSHGSIKPAEIVVFDFDGTLIKASSPVRLISRLNRDRIMPKWAIFKSMVWGLGYKMGTELDQAKPRRYVFSSFKNFAASDANAIMRNLYYEELRPRLRPQALTALEEHRRAGRDIIIVSASFEPIIAACCEDLAIDDFIGTQMEVKNGVYTGETLVDPPESEHKLLQFTAWANNKYGTGNWVLTHAYADHFSDIPLIETALHPIVVDPDHRLEGIAKERGWPIYEWSVKAQG